MAKLFANSGDADQMPHSAAPDLGLVASDLGLQCLPITTLRVSRLQWVKERNIAKKDNSSSQVWHTCIFM